jgi:hypothetical protein
MLNKTKAERIHCKERIIERYGITLNRKELNEVVKRIQSREGARFFDKQSNSRTRWIVNIKEIETLCVYDKVRKQIITFLPMSQVLPLSKFNPYEEGSEKWKAFEKGKKYQRDFDQIKYDWRVKNAG